MEHLAIPVGGVDGVVAMEGVALNAVVLWIVYSTPIDVVFYAIPSVCLGVKPRITEKASFPLDIPTKAVFR